MNKRSAAESILYQNLAVAIYVLVALMRPVLDRRIENTVGKDRSVFSR
jgi:hypothetical protein